MYQGWRVQRERIMNISQMKQELWADFGGCRQSLNASMGRRVEKEKKIQRAVGDKEIKWEKNKRVKQLDTKGNKRKDRKDQ